MKIYVVTQGEYSAYHIVGVTLDRAKAERWVELYNAEDRIYHRDAQIEEYEADEFGNDGMYLWEVSQGWGEDDVVLDTKSGYDYGEWYNGDDNYRVTVMARDKDHALKAAYDKIAKLKYEEEGIG